MPAVKNNINKKDTKVDYSVVKVVCPTCGKLGFENANDFYTSKNPRYIYGGKIPFCKDCLLDIYDYMMARFSNDSEKALNELCKYVDIPFVNDYYISSKKQSENKDAHLFKTYMTRLISQASRSDSKRELNTYSDSDILQVSPQIDYTIDCEKCQYKNIENTEKKVKWSKQDLSNKNDVIKIVGYDVFEYYEERDRKFLYNTLVPYLDESTQEDAYKISQIIQIVKNNLQAENIDNQIALLDIKDDIELIQKLTVTKKSIIDANDKIAKENSISVKNRTDKSINKNNITSMMKKYRDIGFNDVIESYYDIRTAKGMQMSADISMQSILSQLKLNKDDVSEMKLEQTSAISDLQAKVLELEEDKRVLYEKIYLIKQGVEADV